MEESSKQFYRIVDPEVDDSKVNTLDRELLKKLRSTLGYDGQNCIDGIQALVPITSPSVLETFQHLHLRFETVPVLFLSRVDQIIYVWQINRQCPRDNTNKIVLNTIPNPSLLLLGKVQPNYADSGWIHGADFIGDTMLYVKTTTAGNHVEFLLYNIEDFRSTAIINPLKQETPITNLYRYRITAISYIFHGQDPDKVGNMTVTLQKNNNGSVKDLKHVYIEGTSSVLRSHVSNFDVVHKGPSGIISFVDKATTTIIAWREDEIVGLTKKDCPLNQIMRTDTSIYLEDKEKYYYEVDLNAFPSIKIQSRGFPLPTNCQEQVGKWQKINNNDKKVLKTIYYNFFGELKSDVILYNDDKDEKDNNDYEEDIEEEEPENIEEKSEISTDRWRFFSIRFWTSSILFYLFGNKNEWL